MLALHKTTPVHKINTRKRRNHSIRRTYPQLEGKEISDLPDPEIQDEVAVECSLKYSCGSCCCSGTGAAVLSLLGFLSDQRCLGCFCCCCCGTVLASLPLPPLPTLSGCFAAAWRYCSCCCCCRSFLGPTEDTTEPMAKDERVPPPHIDDSISTSSRPSAV